MTDTTEEHAAGRQKVPGPANAYGGLQGAHMLPAADGGGVVFPFGFFGPVYYLPEWEFIRYATYVQQLQSDIHQQPWWRRLFLNPSRWQRWGVLIAVVVGTIVAMRTGFATPKMLWSVVLGATAWNFFHYAFRAYVDHGSRFRQSFPSARRLPLHAYWPAHSLATLLAITRRDYLRILGQIAIRTLIGYYAYETLTKGIVHPVLPLLALPALTLQICQSLVLLVSLATIRLSLGRAPTATDLLPVEPPA